MIYPLAYSILSLIKIGILNWKTVNPCLLCFILIAPPRFFVILWLQFSPIPILSFSGFFNNPCKLFNSKNGTNNNFYLSLVIPMPVSIICVSSTINFWSLVFYISILAWFLTGLQLTTTKISPLKVLYLTAF